MNDDSSRLGTFIREVEREWGAKTLDDFRREAEKELNGSAFQAVRPQGGQWTAILVCMTGQNEIKSAEGIFDFSDEFPAADWKTKSLASVARDSRKAGGIAYEDIIGEDGERSALAICATTPEMVSIFERVFRLPD